MRCSPFARRSSGDALTSLPVAPVPPEPLRLLRGITPVLRSAWLRTWIIELCELRVAAALLVGMHLDNDGAGRIVPVERAVAAPISRAPVTAWLCDRWHRQ